jgi:hypothetical protein
VSKYRRAPPNNEAAINALWLTKAKCRAYEQEWRILMTEGGNAAMRRCYLAVINNH